jgi:hypothetical protein
MLVIRVGWVTGSTFLRFCLRLSPFDHIVSPLKQGFCRPSRLVRRRQATKSHGFPILPSGSAIWWLTDLVAAGISARLMLLSPYSAVYASISVIFHNAK